MELLKQRIMENGRCFEGGILKVDSFINHQMDPDLMKIIGKEFAELYRDSGVNKILTIEASGIAPAIMAGAYMHLPVVFAKKKQPKTMERMLATTIHSFTKDRDYTVCISADYLTPDDRVLIIDDFMAKGYAMRGLIDIVNKAGATLAGIGVAVEKGFQDGGDSLRREGYPIHSLAIIDSAEDGVIRFREGT